MSCFAASRGPKTPVRARTVSKGTGLLTLSNRLTDMLVYTRRDGPTLTAATEPAPPVLALSRVEELDLKHQNEAVEYNAKLAYPTSASLLERSADLFGGQGRRRPRRL